MAEFIINYGRKLPNGLKKRIENTVWNRVIIDKPLLKCLSLYFNFSEKDAMCMLKLGKRLNAELWNILKPNNRQEIEAFYRATPYYIFDLAYWHMQLGQRYFRKEVLKNCKGCVLDFGGGIGDLSLEIDRRDLQVTYADLEGKTFDFALWLFKKHNRQIKSINLTFDGLNDNYDTIICIDVIEHVVEPAKTLKIFAEHLNERGRLIITGPLNQNDDDHPMHIKLDKNLDDYLIELGLSRTKLNWLWIKC